MVHYGTVASLSMQQVHSRYATFKNSNARDWLLAKNK